VKQEEANQNLLRAAQDGNIIAVRAALDSGADPNAKDDCYLRALHWVAMNGHADIARLLIEKGADPNVYTLSQERPLHYAGEHGHADIARLLIEKGADLRAQDAWMRRPVDTAAEKGQTELVKLLEAAQQQQRRGAPRIPDPKATHADDAANHKHGPRQPGD
jgi:ankyrin repeat protein